MPNRWEVPGGACDEDDPTILHGAARELWEEAGLVAKRFTHLVTDSPDPEIEQVFPNSTRTKTWCRFTFHVEVENCDTVKVDPDEHQDFVWASEEEVRQQKIGERELAITHDGVVRLILGVFGLGRENIGMSLQTKDFTYIRTPTENIIGDIDANGRIFTSVMPHSASTARGVTVLQLQANIKYRRRSPD